MARKARDYAAEYARRKEKHLLKGHSLTIARGHKSPQHEKAQRLEARERKIKGVSGPRLTAQGKLNLWVGRTIPREMSGDQWRDIMYANVENRGGTDDVRQELAEKLQKKYEITQAFDRAVKSGKTYDEAAEESGAKEWYDDRDEWDPVEMYWYHDA
jgi:hypothetical protein